MRCMPGPAAITLLSAALATGCDSLNSRGGPPDGPDWHPAPLRCTSPGEGAGGAAPRPPEAVATVQLQMSPEDLDTLYHREVESDDRLPGEASIDSGPPQTLDGLRFRGNTSRHLPKKSFNVRFEDDQPLLFGSARMNANAMYTDPAMMRERLMWDMFARLDQPASRTRYIDLHLNDIYEGLYLHIERVDEGLLAHAGLNPEGTLVRDDFRDARFRNARIDRDSAFGFALSTVPAGEREDLLAASFRSRGTPDWSRLADLILWVEQSEPGPGFEQGFRARFDVDNIIDWLAVHYLAGDFDSFGDDYWLYLDHDDADARWKVIPWDHDLSFGSHWRPGFSIANDYFAYERPVQSEWQNGLIERILATPALAEALGCRLQ